jgi:hypothetical protein
MATVAEEIRGPIEATHNQTRDTREQQYVTDKLALEAAYHSDLHDIQTAKEAALVAAGLNPDGSIPSSTTTPAPINTVTPAITGTPTTGQVLTSSDGGWQRADSYTYQWYRDGVAISGETASTHTLVSADEGHAIKCRVTATNDEGSSFKDSNVVTPTP